MPGRAQIQRSSRGHAHYKGHRCEISDRGYQVSFLHSAADDPARAGYLQQLRVLNKELVIALQKLTECEMAIVKSLERKRNHKGDNSKENNKGRKGETIATSYSI
jgi:hypothetical protein